LSKEQERLIGEELVDRYGPDTVVDERDVAALTKRLELLGRDVRVQFVKALGGEDTLELLDLGTLPRLDPDLAKSFATELKPAVGEATRELPEADARQLADELVDAVEGYAASLNGRGGDADHDRYFSVSPSLGLSYLLDDAKHGTAFL